jgi:hypothetical protein
MMYDADRGDEARRAVEAAKAICATCPVIDECRDWVGLTEAPLDGQNVTAGMNAVEQTEYRKQRKAEREAIRAARIPPCGTATAILRHRDLGETCRYCADVESRRRTKGRVDA